MFGVIAAINALHCAKAMQELELEAEKRFVESIRDKPPEYQEMAIRIRREAREKLAAEREIERRHRELCQAIRDSRPRGICLFI